MLLSDRFQACVIFRRRDGQHGHRPVLVGHPDRLVCRTIGEPRQFLHVRHDPVVPGMEAADGVPKEFFRGWDRRVESLPLGEEICDLGVGASGRQGEQPEDQQADGS